MRRLPPSDFPPVRYQGDAEPWGVPEYSGGAPHNLPANGSRPQFNPLALIGPSTEAPTIAEAQNTVPITDAHRYANIIGLSVNVGIVSGLFLNAPTGRRNFVALRNTSATANIFIDYGQNATVAGSWLRITPNQIVLFDSVVPQDDLYAIADAASATLAFGYSTIPVAS